MWAALVLSLVLGVALVVIDRQEADAAGQVAVPLADEQAVEQVVGSARRIVAAAQLQDAAGGYSFVPCEIRERTSLSGGSLYEFYSAAE